MNTGTNGDTIYTIDMLADMFHLHHGEIEKFIRNQGILYYHLPTLQLVGYIPALGSSFKLTEKTRDICYRNVNLRRGVVKLEDSILSISSKKGLIPASAFLTKPGWVKKASRVLDITTDFHVLVTADKKRPVYCGHEKFVRRLAEEYPIDTQTFQVPPGGDIFNGYA